MTVLHNGDMKTEIGGKTFYLASCLIVAVRTNRLQPLNTQAYNLAICDSVRVAEDVMVACRHARPYLFE